ncbi:MAG: hypothetical protein K2W95_08320 [Candidatus Obscuribacterales bacterium]|nr:hypothetical protein [Candidatus Obscuribacterales bacterium]
MSEVRPDVITNPEPGSLSLACEAAALKMAMEARPAVESVSPLRPNPTTPESIEVTPLPALFPSTPYPATNIGEAAPVTRPTAAPDAGPVEGQLPMAHRPPVTNDREGEGGIGITPTARPAGGSEAGVLAQANAHTSSTNRSAAPEGSSVLNGAANPLDGSRPEGGTPVDRVALPAQGKPSGNAPDGEFQLPGAKPPADFQLPPSPGRPLSRVSAPGEEFSLPPVPRPQQRDVPASASRPAMPSNEFQLAGATPHHVPPVSSGTGDVKQSGGTAGSSPLEANVIPSDHHPVSAPNAGDTPPKDHKCSPLDNPNPTAVTNIAGATPGQSIGGHPGGQAASRAGEAGIRIIPAGNPSIQGVSGEAEFKPGMGAPFGSIPNRPAVPTPVEPIYTSGSGRLHQSDSPYTPLGQGERNEARLAIPGLVSLQQGTGPRTGENGGHPVQPGVTVPNDQICIVSNIYKPLPGPGSDLALSAASPRYNIPSAGDVLHHSINFSGSPKPGKEPLAEVCLVSSTTGQPLNLATVLRTEQEIARRIPQPEPAPQSAPRIAFSDHAQSLTTLINNISKNTEAIQLPPASKPSQELQSDLRRLLSNEVSPPVVSRNDRHPDCGDVCPVVPPVRKEEIKPAAERAVEFVARLHDLLNSKEPFLARDTVKQDPDLIRVRPADLAQWIAPRETERVGDRVSDRIASDIASRVQLETLPFASSPLRPALELARSSTTVAKATAIDSAARSSEVLGRTAVEAQSIRVPADKTIDSRLSIIPANDAGRITQVVASNFPADRIGNLAVGGITGDGKASPGVTTDGRVIPSAIADGRVVLADGRIVVSSEVRSADGRQVQTVLPDGRAVMSDGRILMPDGKIVGPDGKTAPGNQPGLTLDPKAVDGRPSTVETQSADRGSKNIVMDPVLGPVRIVVTASGETIMVPVDQKLAPGSEKTGDRKDVIDKKSDKEKEEEDKEKELAALIAKKKERKPEQKDDVKTDDKTTKQQPLQQRRKYLVRTGDTVESVASSQLGDQRYSVLICIINRAVIRFDWEGAKSTAKLRVGQIIWLPSPAEMQVHRAMFFKNAEPAGAGNLGANSEEQQAPGDETVELEEVNLPELQLTDSDTITKVQSALDTVNLAPATNSPLPPVPPPLQGISCVPAKIGGRPSLRVSSPDFNKTDSENDLALAERNWNLLSNKIADAVAVVRDTRTTNVAETIQQQMLIERMATVIADCTAKPGNAASFLPGALRNTNDNQNAPGTILMSVQRANCICRVVTVENPEAKSFSTRLQISNNATDWSTVASYECSEKHAVRYLNKGNGTVDTFTLRLPPTVIRNMASQDLIRNWESYVSSYGR